MQSQQGALASRGGTNVTGEINIFLGVQFDRAADFANDPHVQSHCNHHRGRASLAGGGVVHIHNGGRIPTRERHTRRPQQSGNRQEAPAKKAARPARLSLARQPAVV